MFQDIFHVPLRVDDIEIVINCPARHVEQVSKLKRKQGASGFVQIIHDSQMCTNECKHIRVVADRHFTEYMGAFYGKVMAAGLVERGYCMIDSSEVLKNVEKMWQDEEAETKKRSVAADGLVSMANVGAASSSKCEYTKIWTLFSLHWVRKKLRTLSSH